jgi:hypothetical protein
MAEHMYAKCTQLGTNLYSDTAESVADLLYEIGKQALTKCNYEAAVRWLERSYVMLGEQNIGMLSPEAGELRLCVLQGLGKSFRCRSSADKLTGSVQANLKLQTAEAVDRAWELVKLMEADYCDKMVVSLLKIELLSSDEHIDGAEFYKGRVYGRID